MHRRAFHSSVSLYRGSSSKEWLQRQRTDPYVAKRHAEGYRARSAYKLLEMNEKYNQNAHGKYNEKAASGKL